MQFFVRFFLFLLVLASMSFLVIQKAYATPPPGFEKTTIVSNLSAPTAMAIAPDGRIFITEKEGKVKIIKNGQLLATPFLQLQENNHVERGVLGIALDPSFSTNKYVYIYYVYDPSPTNPDDAPDGLEIRVSRFTAIGDSAPLSSEKVLLKSTEPLGDIHHAGTVRFGPDGKLWISVGDNGKRENAQNLGNIHGKILRINKDGTIPSDNPFANQSGKNAAIWAYGLRNPFRFNFLPDGRPIVGDVGQEAFEEVNIVTKGGNYGWPNAEGFCSNCPYINPVHAYNHSNPERGASITGGFVYTYNGANSFPAEYRNSYFYGDFAQAFIKRLTLDQQGRVTGEEVFDTTDAKDAVVDFAQGPNGSMYYVSIFDWEKAPYSSGSVYKIAYEGENAAPTAVIAASPTAGKIPLLVRFASSGSSDPEGKPLSYKWNFGDGQTSTEANPTHKYVQKGTFTASLVVSDGTKESQAATITINAGNQLPRPRILTPKAGTKYNAGQTVSFKGTARDPESGKLPASAFSWRLTSWHYDEGETSDSAHPHLTSKIDGVEEGVFTIPDTGEPLPNSWYEITLTVTDPQGLQDTAKTAIYPNTAQLTFKTDPSGLNLLLDGSPITTPKIVKSVVGFKRNVDVPSQTVNGKTYEFVSWSDTGAKSHTIVTPNTPTTYTATFKERVEKGKIHLRVHEFSETGERLGFLNGATAKLLSLDNSMVLGIATSSAVNTDDGWVHFDNIPEGSYNIVVFKHGLKGYWKQTACSGQGTTENATIQNNHTEGHTAGYQAAVAVLGGQITYCKDIGLRKESQQQFGNVYFRVHAFSEAGSPTGTFLSDATSKVLNSQGQVVATGTSRTINNQDGWVTFNNLPVGSYTIVTYKAGYRGHWRQTTCSNQGTTDNVTIQNETTEGMVAAKQENIAVTEGQTTWCKDVGLKVSPIQPALPPRDGEPPSGTPTQPEAITPTQHATPTETATPSAAPSPRE